MVGIIDNLSEWNWRYGKIGNFFSKWKFPTLCLLYLFVRSVEYGLTNSSQSAKHNNKEYSRFLEIRINPPRGSFIEAACFHSNEAGEQTPVHYKKYEKPGAFKLPLSDEKLEGTYFCDALQGEIGSSPTLSTKDFPIFGDYIPKQSSVWIIDDLGRRMVIPSQDYIGNWHTYPNYD